MIKHSNELSMVFFVFSLRKREEKRGDVKPKKRKEKEKQLNRIIVSKS